VLSPWLRGPFSGEGAMNTSRLLGNRVRTRLLATLSLLVAAASARLSAADDVTGEWEVKMDRNGRETFATLTISKQVDGSYKGKWGSTDLSDVKVDGQKLTFVRTLKFGDNEFKMNYEGTLKDGVITGSVSSDRGSFAANASRKKPRSPILGRWDFKYTVGDREISATLAVSEAAVGAGLEGKWTSSFGEHTVSNVKFEGNKLTLSRKSKFPDRELESTYEGTLAGNKLTGTIKSDLGEIPASAERAGGNLIGKWELKASSDRGPRTRPHPGCCAPPRR